MVQYQSSIYNSFKFIVKGKHYFLNVSYCTQGIRRHSINTYRNTANTEPDLALLYYLKRDVILDCRKRWSLQVWEPIIWLIGQLTGT